VIAILDKAEICNYMNSNREEYPNDADGYFPAD
jgi:hypothetical protein